MKSKRILVVEDEANIRLGLVAILEGEGYAVEECASGDQAIESVEAFRPDLLLLDVMLPGANGFDICRDLRRRGFRGAILMLTAKSQELDKVVGLDSGADDYVTKPFGVQELIARVRSAFRRLERDQDTATGSGSSVNNGSESEIQLPEDRFWMGAAEIDPKRYQLRRDGESVPLTPRELKLLAYFQSHPEEVHSRDQLLSIVWGREYKGTTRTLDQTIVQLRKKLGENGDQPRHLLTVHGVGYRWVA